MRSHIGNITLTRARIVHLVSIICFFSIFFSNPSTAEQTQSESVHAPEESLTQFMPTECIFSGRFQQIKKTENFNLESKGTLLYNCNYGLIWQSLDPFLETTIYKINGQHILITEDNDTEELTSQSQKGLANFLLRLMSGDKSYFLESFSIENVDKSLKLIPNSKFMKKAIDNIVLSSERAPDSLDIFSISTIINATNGDATKVVIDSLKAFHPDSEATQDLICAQTINHQDIICKILKRKKINAYKR